MNANNRSAEKRAKWIDDKRFTGLQDIELRVLVYLHRTSEKLGSCFWTQAQIARDLIHDDASISRALATLEKKRYLIREKKGWRGHYKFTIFTLTETGRTLVRWWLKPDEKTSKVPPAGLMSDQAPLDVETNEHDVISNADMMSDQADMMSDQAPLDVTSSHTLEQDLQTNNNDMNTSIADALTSLQQLKIDTANFETMMLQRILNPQWVLCAAKFVAESNESSPGVILKPGGYLVSLFDSAKRGKPWYGFTLKNGELVPPRQEKKEELTPAVKKSLAERERNQRNAATNEQVKQRQAPRDEHLKRSKAFFHSLSESEKQTFRESVIKNDPSMNRFPGLLDERAAERAWEEMGPGSEDYRIQLASWWSGLSKENQDIVKNLMGGDLFAMASQVRKHEQALEAFNADLLVNADPPPAKK